MGDLTLEQHARRLLDGMERALSPGLAGRLAVCFVLDADFWMKHIGDEARRDADLWATLHDFTAEHDRKSRPVPPALAKWIAEVEPTSRRRRPKRAGPGRPSEAGRQRVIADTGAQLISLGYGKKPAAKMIAARRWAPGFSRVYAIITGQFKDPHKPSSPPGIVHSWKDRKETLAMFDPEKLYQTDDPALEVLGRPATLAIWRSAGRGPVYIKLGNRVLYHGSALNEYLAARVVTPAAVREARAGVPEGTRPGA